MSQTSQTQIVKRIEEITEACIKSKGSCTTEECSQEHERRYGFTLGANYIRSVWDHLGQWDVTHQLSYTATKKDIEEHG